ncbi:MAG: response regulator transcription factor [Clostridiales bacterium]|nr:response regulator transcription factor [Clostridiales bacterium]
MNILLVEDDKTLAMGIEYSLKNEGFTVYGALNLKEAREKLNQEKIDLILLDVTLPDGNGYEFCKEVRTNNSVPIIFLTACDEEVNIVLGLDMGADDYLTKPVRVRELIARINAVYRRKQTDSDDNNTNKLIFKEITIYPMKFEVYKKGEKLQLTAVEYKLLMLLVENVGNVLTRKQLLERIWDIEGDFIEEKTLTVYIKRLREKLGDNNNNYIETVRGIGYKWIG